MFRSTISKVTPCTHFTWRGFNRRPNPALQRTGFAGR
jgi:hypothetical protein